MRRVALGCTLAALIFGWGGQAEAQSPSERRGEVNAGVVGVIAAKRTGTMTVFADDIAAVLGDVDGLRVLPILGRGSLGNIEDLLYLRGVDVALTQGDVLDFYKEFQLESNLEKKIGYIAALGLEEAHLLAREEFNSVDELVGKKINFGWNGSGSFLSASIIFDNLGLRVQAEVDLHKVAMKKLRDGDIDAIFWMGGSPIDALEKLDGTEGLKFLSIPPERVTASTYAPAKLTHTDYPSLIREREEIETVQVSTVMAAYKWPEDHPRGRALDHFTKSLFGRAAELRQEPYHPKWQTMELGADVPGWTRIHAPSQQLTSRE